MASLRVRAGDGRKGEKLNIIYLTQSRVAAGHRPDEGEGERRPGLVPRTLARYVYRAGGLGREKCRSSLRLSIRTVALSDLLCGLPATLLIHTRAAMP